MIRRRYSRKTGFRFDYTDTFQRSCRRRGHDTDLKGTISRTFLCPIATFLRLKLCLVEYADKRICKNEKCRETGLACLYRAKKKTNFSRNFFDTVPFSSSLCAFHDLHVDPSGVESAAIEIRRAFANVLGICCNLPGLLYS